MRKLAKTQRLALLGLLTVACGGTPVAHNSSPAKTLGVTHPQFKADSPDDVNEKASAQLRRTNGKSAVVGTLMLVQKDERVTLRGKFTNLPKGTRAIQIHANGTCNGKNSRAHFNPTEAKHGPPESSNRHVGDLGNIEVAQDGTASFEMTTDSLSLVEGGPSSVLGRTVVITQHMDDGKTQPDGKAGPAIACGVIKAR